ncbi:T9SS type A sorting domain-containing protein [Taibaiella koreensis]|uniref:T9SS type A sorting domain-containing protein n=1 Tax=Taibaiella koreensis TaxID=1268548 RepID=UPI000E59A658|nr:T9SS type A sorting domain-containing protein [Taibaiella koreensis]
MKQKLFLLAAMLLTVGAAKAATVTISAAGLVFNPANVTITLGDTLKFVYASGMDHTTTSTTIPSGAAPWNAPLTPSSNTFIYVPSVAGNYAYVCTPHASLGMVGTFTVNAPAGIADREIVSALFDIYPNPASNVLQVAQKSTTRPAIVTVTDVNGRQLLQATTNGGTARLDVSALVKGLYFVNINQDGKHYVSKFTVDR